MSAALIPEKALRLVCMSQFETKRWLERRIRLGRIKDRDELMNELLVRCCAAVLARHRIDEVVDKGSLLGLLRRTGRKVKTIWR
jgi:hypothetical protein